MHTLKNTQRESKSSTDQTIRQSERLTPHGWGSADACVLTRGNGSSFYMRLQGSWACPARGPASRARRPFPATALGRVACCGGSVLATPRRTVEGSDRFALLRPLTQPKAKGTFPHEANREPVPIHPEQGRSSSSAPAATAARVDAYVAGWGGLNAADEVTGGLAEHANSCVSKVRHNVRVCDSLLFESRPCRIRLDHRQRHALLVGEDIEAQRSLTCRACAHCGPVTAYAPY